MSYLCNRNRETNNVSRDAQMAESVDALVSNTSGFTSIPVRPRVWVRNKEAGKVLMLFPAFFLYLSFMPFAHGNRYLARDRSTESRICEAWYQSGVNVTI